MTASTDTSFNPKTQAHQDKANPPPLIYGCVCSGISAPTLAAKPLGWQTKFFSEIEAFPRAILAHHYPEIPVHGDFTTINGDTYGTVELLVGGTPCQSFSVAGKRLGLDDPRGNLALEYVRLAERVDAKWMVFENVPGLLSSADGEDFAAFISAITGHEYRSPAAGWSNAGIAAGKPGRWGIAWRILDAQYFGVAQRRRRLFVVGYRGDWRPAAAVLLEPESMRGDSPPSRSAGKAVAALTATGVGTCGADDNQGQSGHLIAGTLEAASGRSRGAGISPGSLVPYNIIGGGQKGKNHAYQTEVSGCLQHKGLAATGNEAGTLIASTGEISHCLNAGGMGRQDFETETLIAHTLRGDGFDASEDGTGRGTPLIPIAFTARDNGRDATYDLAPTMRSLSKGADGHQSGAHGLAIATPTSAVRRLTPRECERLQGMPDDYTLIPWRKKPASECPDGPRYKAIGNSMAVPVMRWIFERIDHVRHTVK